MTTMIYGTSYIDTSMDIEPSTRGRDWREIYESAVANAVMRASVAYARECAVQLAIWRDWQLTEGERSEWLTAMVSSTSHENGSGA